MQLFYFFSHVELITWDELEQFFGDLFVTPSTSQTMQESFAQFTSLSRYATQVISNPLEKYYRFLTRLRDQVCQSLITLHIKDLLS
ncbi:hypothetical protein IEQ34_026544 [Dendrobium chrysotoxum]|uniref:Uncharacterized protein n=1 Tax=Dendrobium chrysotoxum TaxID=161865 RepID=A0AAV7FLW1_DENCH|nr:hypothetical protein IEQ34_026544 [Dendrobium chrysotoxum]